MKKIFTLIFALTAFTSGVFAQTPVSANLASNGNLFITFASTADRDLFLVTTPVNTVMTATPGGTGDLKNNTGAGNNRVRFKIPIPFPAGLTAGPYEGVVSGAGFDPFTFDANGNILPVSLSSFTAKKMEKSVLLNWETEMEINNDYFAVERSINGKDFEELTKVSGEGNSEVSVVYDFEDRAPESATNYYRLRQVDFDGTEDFSEIISVKFKDTHSDLNLYPTMTEDNLTVDLIDYTEAELNVEIRSISGALIRTFTLNGATKSFVNVADLMSGTYFMSVQSKNGIATAKFVVK